jgi:E3 ubiquitin-protein ligase SIAH1
MALQDPEEGKWGGVAMRRTAAAAADVSMELDILDCPVCYQPLRPPIFQVHVLCTFKFLICSSPVEFVSS